MKKSLVIALSCSSWASYAQTSPYYVTYSDYDTLGKTYVMQNGEPIFAFQHAAQLQLPIIVGDFGSGRRIRQAMGIPPYTGKPGQGDEYELDGTPTGHMNFWNGDGGPPETSVYDAAFDGESVYMVHWGGTTDGHVFRYDDNFGNGQMLFPAFTGAIGITYDSLTSTLWLSSWFTLGNVKQYALDGTELSEFHVNGGASALAYDATDDTLWMYEIGNRSFAQYSRTGKRLRGYAGINTVWGGEILPVPESNPLFVLAAGLAMLYVLRR